MLWTHRSIAAEPEAAWALLTDLDRWPDWGPSVRGAQLDDEAGGFTAGATGRVTTALGPSVPFRLTRVDDGGFDGDGRRWSWSVAGVPATSHSVASAPGGCVVGFGVPVPVTPYLVVCALALRRIEALLTR